MSQLPFGLLRRVAVTGGVHGDEPSGAAALLPLAELGFPTHGPCNLWGLAHHRRELESGRDLNRCFARADVPEAEAARRFLTFQQPRVVLDLHEDSRASHPYLIQFAPGDARGRALAARLAEGGEGLHRRPRWGPVTGRDGLLVPGRLSLWCVGLSRRWSLAYWAWRSMGALAFVVEAPGGWALERRIAFHVAVAKATLNVL